jgi:hypothetical protein
VLKWILILGVSIIVLVGAPFIGFGKDYDAVCADAAAMFGIAPDEYEVHITDSAVLNAAGEEVNGTFALTLDGTARGGVVVAIAMQFGLPVVFTGVGEKIDDLLPFDPAKFAQIIVGIGGKDG